MIRKNILSELKYVGRTMGVLAGLLIVASFFIVAGRNKIASLEATLSQKPIEILRLYGTTETNQFPAVFETFFMVLLFANLVVAGIVLFNTIYNWNTESENGTIGFFCGQYISRRKFYIMKFIVAACFTCIVWFTYIIICLLCIVFIGRITHTGADISYSLLSKMFLRGLIIMFLFMSAGALYASLPKRPIKASGMSLLVVITTFACGNLYKIADSIAYYQRAGLIKDDSMMAIYGFLVKFKNLSPLSWLNVFYINKAVLKPGMLVAFAITAVLLCAGAVAINETKEISE